MHAYCHTHSIFDNNYDNAEEKGERERGKRQEKKSEENQQKYYIIIKK